MHLWQLARLAMACSLTRSVSVGIVSAVRHDVALADRAGSVLIKVPAAEFVRGLPPPGDRLTVMLLLGAAWALRLSLFITWRTLGQAEGRRYRQMRQRDQPHFAWKSLHLVFGLQALPAWLVSLVVVLRAP